MLSAATINKIFATFQKLNPEPKTELNYTNPFTLLVAVVLSAQSTDAGVNRATEKLFQVADNPAAMAALGLAGIKKHIKTIGLFNTKAANVLALSKTLRDAYGGEIPRTREGLEKLPGVGRKTANVVMNVVYGEPTMAVDTHIFRMGNRIGLAPGKTPREVEDGLMRVIPKKYMQHAHHWLILHGRYICTARTPKCRECPIMQWCEYPDKNL
ncbi:MAG TPA: endonuclease III [Rhodospirillaceae bacterium]|nr:endonuclease III [Rhodospirillaceae bacterium]